MVMDIYMNMIEYMDQMALDNEPAMRDWWRMGVFYMTEMGMILSMELVSEMLLLSKLRYGVQRKKKKDYKRRRYRMS